MSITLTELIKEQGYNCLIMFCGGMVFMFTYQLCSFLSRQVSIKKWIRAGIEILYWLAAAVMISEFLYYCSYGALSVHALGAFGAGLLLWKLCFYDIIPLHQLKIKKGMKKTWQRNDEAVNTGTAAESSTLMRLAQSAGKSGRSSKKR